MRVLSRAGDSVKEDDIIAQLETDKVTIDIKYSGKQAGALTQLLIREQDVVQVGKVVAVVEQGAAGNATAAPAAPKPEAAAAPAQQAKPAAAKPAPVKVCIQLLLLVSAHAQYHGMHYVLHG